MTEQSGGSSYQPSGGSSYQPGGSPPSEPSGSSTYEPGATGQTTGQMGGESAEAGRGREWLGQLQSMIDNVATQASPILKDIAAKAAELAATAAEKAGPIAHKAADATEAAGHKLAERGREVAAELRREQGQGGEGAAAGDSPNAIEPGPGATSNPGNRRPGAVADSADSLGE